MRRKETRQQMRLESVLKGRVNEDSSQTTSVVQSRVPVESTWRGLRRGDDRHQVRDKADDAIFQTGISKIPGT